MSSGNVTLPRAEKIELALIARQYIDLGLCALPANRQKKYTTIGKWTKYKSELPHEDLWPQARHSDAICIITGKVSGNLELIDFDFKAELFEAWRKLIEELAPGLFELLVIEQSQSGGKHVFYRCMEATIEGNQKLAKKYIDCENGDEITYRGKTVKPRRIGGPDGKWSAEICLIETRGEGGLVLCAPSPGYEFTQRDFTEIPTVTAEQRRFLLNLASLLTEMGEDLHPAPTKASKPNGTQLADRPGDDYNKRGDVHALLQHQGWGFLHRTGEQELWRRPGKTGSNWSASLKGRQFYVFSSNAAPLEAGKCYGPFGLFAALEHNGDFNEAAKALRKLGFGAEEKRTPRSFDEKENRPQDDDYLEAELLDVRPVQKAKRPPPPEPPPRIDTASYSMPGFVDELMEYTLKSAPYPSIPLAFCGALTLLGTLAGRKVRGPTRLATNLYVCGLAASGSGKDHPRQVNSRILTQIDMADRLTGRVASGQGLEEAVFKQPSLLMQLDEFDAVMVAINRPGDAVGSEFGARLMEFYTASQSTYNLRLKAQEESRRQIVHPHLSMFATAVQTAFYENLTAKVLSNGLVARMLVVEAGPRGLGQDVDATPIPDCIIDAAEFWRDFNPEHPNDFSGKHPRLIEYDYTAREVFAESRGKAEDEYDRCHTAGDNNGCAIWARVIEQAHKLAMLYAISENRVAPIVGEEAARWAVRFASIHAMWLLSQVDDRGGMDTRLEKNIQMVLKRINRRGGKAMWPDCLKASKVSAKEFQEIANTMVQRGQVVLENEGDTKYLLLPRRA